MKNKLISFILALCLFIAIPLEARYKYNPFTRKLDYYETGEDINLGDLADVTFTALASGAVLYYNGSAWVNLPKGSDGEHLGLTSGLPAWEVAVELTFLGLTDTPSAYTGKAGQLVRVNAVPDGLEFFAGSAAGTVIVADGSGGWTKDENFNIVSGKVSAGGYEGTAIANAYIAGIDQDLLTSSSPSFVDLTISTPVNVYDLSHDSFADWVANKHIDWTGAAVNFSTSGSVTVGSIIGPAAAPLILNDTLVQNVELFTNTGGNPLFKIWGFDGEGIQWGTLEVDNTGKFRLTSSGGIYFDQATQFMEDVTFTWDAVGDQYRINQTSVAGVATQPLFKIDDDRTGGTADTPAEATMLIDAAGAYSLYLQNGAAQFDVDATQTEDVFWTWGDAADHAVITQSNTGHTEDQPLIFIDDDRDDEHAVELSEATIIIDADGYYALYIADGMFYIVEKSTFAGNVDFNEDVKFDWSDSADRWWMVQSDTTGTDSVPLMYIDDDRTGTYADNVNEATLYINAAGAYAFYIANGDFRVEDIFEYDYMTEHVLVVGYLAGEDLAAGGQYNTLVGESAGANVTTGDDNTFVGYQAGLNILTGQKNTAVGYEAGLGKVSNNWSNNSLFGYRAGYNLENNANNNTFLGYEAGYNEKTGTSNTYVGYKAGYSANPNGGSTYNVAIGFQSLYGNVVGGDGNIAIGFNAAYSNTTGDRNVAIGYECLYWNDLGGNNVVLGYSAAKGTSGEDISNNVIIGAFAAEDISTGDANVVIGYMAGEGWLDTESDKLVIDNTDTATPLIYGEFDNDFIRIHGEFKLPDNNIQTFGTDEDASLEYDETTNDAWIFGVPSTNQRGIILVDKADIAADLTAVILTAAQPRFNILDADLDSDLTLGFYGDDTPTIQARLHPLNINWGAEQSAYFFLDSDIAENKEVRIYGYDTGLATAIYGKFLVDSAGKFTITAQETPIVFTTQLRVPVSKAPVSNPPTDAELDAAFGTPATFGEGFFTYIDDNGAGNDFYHIVSDGTNWWIFSATERITKCYEFANADLGQGGTKPDNIIVGNYRGWSYDIADDSVFTVKLPDDWVTGTDIEIHVRWAINEDYITDSGEVRWQATWSAVPADASEAIGGAGTTDDSGDINIPATAYFLTQTLIETIPGGSLSPGDEIGITIERIALVGGNNPTADPVITCVGFVYTADKLGKAI